MIIRCKVKFILWIAFFVAISISAIVFNKIYDFYQVNCGSMLPTLKSGDIILVKKVINSNIENKKGNLTLGDESVDSNIKRESIYVFSLPVYISNKKLPNELYVKRCVGTSGDIFRIIDRHLLINSTSCKVNYINPIKIDKSIMLDFNNPIYGTNLGCYFPHDSIFSWDSNNYGPLYIPKRNSKIQLTDSMKILYRDIMFYEMKNALNNKLTSVDEYIFKKDYYYFVGDNLCGSTDSRHWGLIPKENIIAEVKCIVWSKSFKTILKRLK